MKAQLLLLFVVSSSIAKQKGTHVTFRIFCDSKLVYLIVYDTQRLQ